LLLAGWVKEERLEVKKMRGRGLADVRNKSSSRWEFVEGGSDVAAISDTWEDVAYSGKDARSR
jgi:hypothetical protein